MSSTPMSWLRTAVRSLALLREKNRQLLAAGLLSLFAAGLLHSPVLHAETLLTLKANGQTLDVTRAQLEALPQHQVLTSTPWTEGVKDFRGPLMRDVLDLLDAPIADNATLSLIALNDYEVDVSHQDYRQWDVILAHQLDGKTLTRATNGPLWVIYPRDQTPALQDSRVDYRWAWMLRTVIAKP
ncbi:MAG: hypothetical protein ACN6O6_06645 [Pseudomonas sp.]|uniref:hypothetical protein n=1 Tax=Pseudomonas sp. TaxID=306 RepID=UPI003D13A147